METAENNLFFYTYILQSKTTGGLYVGYTSDIERRLLQHNESNGKYTSNKGPWVFIFHKKLNSKKEAISLERQLKRWKSKERILEWIEREKLQNTNTSH